MNPEWLIGIQVVVAIAIIGWSLVAHARISDRIVQVEAGAAKTADLNPLVSRIAVVEGDMRTKIGELHVRANDIQRDYVRRDDFHREVEGMGRQLEEIKASQRDDAARINSRLDTILALLGRQAPAGE